MRRTAVAVTGFGYVIGVVAAGGLSPASASAAGHGLARSHVSRAGSSAIETRSKQSGPGTPATSGTAASGMQTVEYNGYSVTVPASWQVFHLDSDPGQCVRYDINAVYLGSPGANQNCPSNLMGRAETITITPAGVSGSSSQASGGQADQAGQAGEQGAAAQGGLVQSPPPGETGRAISAKASSFSRMSQYSQDNELRGSVAGTNLSVTATYGSDPAPVTRYLSSLHRDQPLRAGSPSGTTAPAKSPATTKAPATTSSTTQGSSNGKPVSTLASTLKPSVPSSPLEGFDTCTAPSLNAMKAWKATYSAIGIYIGGQNMACDYGNLSASWVRSVTAMGWSLIPLYVGLQAPCNGFSQEIQPNAAASEGIGSARSAISDARSFGLGRGTPIYFDMEAYNSGAKGCRNSVLSFLNQWTRQLHTHGYVSGVYSSAASGAEDLGSATAVYGHPVTKPDSMWFALWDNKANLVGTPYLLGSWWNPDRRIKQYKGSHWVKAGGVKLNVDSDWVQGPVY